MLTAARLLAAALVLSWTLPAFEIAPPLFEIAVRSRAVEPGELVVVTVTTSSAEDRPRVRAFNHDIEPYRLDDHRWQALVGIDLDVKPGTYPITVSAANATAAAGYDLVVGPHAFRTRRLSVNEAFVTPPASEEERIAREARLLDQIWKSPSPTRLWAEPFVRPVPGAANSAFGTRSIFNGKPRNAHGGADFLSPAGTPIHAAQRRPRRAGSRHVFFRQHRDHRPRPGTVFDAGALVGHPDARRRPGEARPGGRTGGRDRPCDRPASALGGARQRRASRSALAARVARWRVLRAGALSSIDQHRRARR